MKSKNRALVQLGNNIRKVRLQKNLSQEKLALNAGLDRTYVGGVERGERNITILKLILIATSLNVSPAVLIKNLKGGSK